MICWYCHWGWPKQVADIYERGLAVAGDSAMHFGPAHIVWEDENFDSECIQWCIDQAEKYKSEKIREDLTDGQIAAVVQSLVELLAVPEEIRCCQPETYDGEHPENYPPADGLVMIGTK